MKVKLMFKGQASALNEWAANAQDDFDGYYGAGYKGYPSPENGCPGFGMNDKGRFFWRTCRGNITTVWAAGINLFVVYEGRRARCGMDFPSGLRDRDAVVLQYNSSEPELLWYEQAAEAAHKLSFEAVLKLLRTSSLDFIDITKHPEIKPLLPYFSSEKKAAAGLHRNELMKLIALKKAWFSNGRTKLPL